MCMRLQVLFGCLSKLNTFARLFSRIQGLLQDWLYLYYRKTPHFAKYDTEDWLSIIGLSAWVYQEAYRLRGTTSQTLSDHA